MKREDGKKLLERIRILAENDVFVDAHLKLATVEAKAEIGSSDVSQEFIDDVIINKYLLDMASNLLFFQTKRACILQDHVDELIKNIKESKNDGK
jgi:hypothetical protein